MPTIRGLPGPFRLYFYSSDCAEPMHVHARRGDGECKFWLDPLELAFAVGLTRAELREARNTILENRLAIVEAWHEHCRSKQS